jgi:hypothetical protein
MAKTKCQREKAGLSLANIDEDIDAENDEESS